MASWQHALCGFFNHVSVLTELIKRRVKERGRERVSRLISCRIELDFQVECVSARNRETRTRPFDVRHRPLAFSLCLCLLAAIKRYHLVSRYFVTSPPNNRFIKIFSPPRGRNLSVVHVNKRVRKIRICVPRRLRQIDWHWIPNGNSFYLI